VELDVGRGLRIGEERLLMEQKDQTGALSELERDRASAHDDLSLSQEVRRE
jgi:hypothetical protein